MGDKKEHEIVEINSSAIVFEFKNKKKQIDGYKNENYSPPYREIFYLAFFSVILMKKIKLSYLPRYF